LIEKFKQIRREAIDEDYRAHVSFIENLDIIKELQQGVRNGDNSFAIKGKDGGLYYNYFTDEQIQHLITLLNQKVIDQHVEDLVWVCAYNKLIVYLKIKLGIESRIPSFRTYFLSN